MHKHVWSSIESLMRWRAVPPDWVESVASLLTDIGLERSPDGKAHLIASEMLVSLHLDGSLGITEAMLREFCTLTSRQGSWIGRSISPTPSIDKNVKLRWRAASLVRSWQQVLARSAADVCAVLDDEQQHSEFYRVAADLLERLRAEGVDECLVCSMLHAGG